MLFFVAVAHGADYGSGSISGTVRCQTQSVANAIVYLNVTGSRWDTTNLWPVVFRQFQSEWTPRIQLGRSGALLVLQNDDPTLHVVTLDLLRGTNQPHRLLTEAMPYAGYQKAFQIEAFREPVLLKASTGNGERAVGYVALLPHSWGALTGADGRFTIGAVPAGAYKIYAWSEAHGTLIRDVKVSSGQATELSLDFPPAKVTATGRQRAD
ncbi:MAG: hypothetical protein PCFJNLEI_01229 [Verrucomicrobiae bacterium]|nr:hypothetical protein [Verrucomicrobiae bacterium]